MATCHLCITSPDYANVLLEHESGVWRFPAVQAYAGFFANVGPVADAARSCWGIELTLLHCLDDRLTPEDRPEAPTYAARLENPKAELPEGFTWVPLSDLAEGRTSATDTEHHSAPGRLSLASDYAAGPKATPWETAQDWRSRVDSWVETALQGTPFSITGPLRQLRTWSISAMFVVPTVEGKVFFKASPNLFRGEAAITHDLFQRFPDHSPEVIAFDGGRNWLLMRDVGGPTYRHEHGIEAWRDALGALARIQQDYAQRAPELTGMGLPRRKVTTIPARFFRSVGALSRLGTPISRDDYHRNLDFLADSIDRIGEACAELESHGLPLTLDHGDLDPGNMMLRDETSVLIDWSDAAVTHPFFTAAALEAAARDRELPIDHYLDAWTDYASPADLRRAFALSAPLGMLDRALHHHDDILINTVPGFERRWLESLMPHFINSASESLRSLGI